MGIFDVFRKSGPSKDDIIKEMTDPSKKVVRALWRFMGENTPISKEDNTENYVKYGYNLNYLVFAIVQWKAQKSAQVPFKVYRMVNGKKEKVEKHWVYDLFNKPNEWQGGQEFFEQMYGFKELDGNSYIYTPKLENGANAGQVPEMHVLPAPITEIVTGDNWNPIGGYRVEYSNTLNDFAADEVIHLRYANYDFDYQSYVYGVSPMRAAWQVVQKSNSNQEASKKAFDNMGALGMLYQKDKEYAQMMTDNSRRKAQNQLDKKVRGTDQKGRILHSVGDFGYINFGANPVDLALIEDEKMSIRQICTAFHVQSQLFGDTEGSTYNNMQEARKVSYVDGIKPNVEGFASEFNRAVMSPLGDEFIEPDWSAVPELQPDRAELAKWLSIANYLDENEKRDIMGYEPKEGLDVNLYPAGMLPFGESFEDIDPEKALSIYRNGK